MTKAQKQRNKSIKSFLSIIALAIAIYLGFTPLYELINEGVAGNVVGASFAAIFAIILTYYLLVGNIGYLDMFVKNTKNKQDKQ